MNDVDGPLPGDARHLPPPAPEVERLWLNANLSLPRSCVAWHAMRAQGAGGQHVNTTASAIHLRFDVAASDLPEPVRDRLLAGRDQRLSRDGVVVIKAQQHRSQEQNRLAALARLASLIEVAQNPPRPRKPTRVPKSAKRRRVDDKTRRGSVKRLRRRDPGAD